MNTVKDFISSNATMLITGLFLIGMNYGILKAAVDNKIDEKTAREICDKEITDLVLPQLNEQNAIIKRMLDKDFSDTKVQLEIKFNLKILMQAHGLKYIEEKE